MPSPPTPVRPFADDLAAAYEELRQRQVTELFEAMTNPALMEVPEGRFRGGFDGSSLSCDCICHNVLGLGLGRGGRRRRRLKPQPSSCEHCRVYG